MNVSNEWVEMDQKLPAEGRSEAEEFADRLRRCAEGREWVDLFGVPYMPCPVGTDGNEIRVGGVCWDGTSHRYVTVSSLEYVGGGWVVHDTESGMHTPSALSEASVEGVLSDMHDELLHVWQSDMDNALRQDRIDEIQARYAKVLRLGGRP